MCPYHIATTLTLYLTRLWASAATQRSPDQKACSHQAREHVETAKAATVKGMTPRTSTGAPSPASRRTTTIEPRNPLEEAAWRGNFGAVPARTSTSSDGTASKAEAKARAAAEELARLKAAAEKRASQQRRRRARRTRSAKATTAA